MYSTPGGTPHTLSSVVEITIKVMHCTPGGTPHTLSSVVELILRSCAVHQEGLHTLCPRGYFNVIDAIKIHLMITL